MLLRFVFSNYLSFADEVDFNLFPYERLKTHKDHIIATPEVNLLKVAAVYGKNGAGKSNLIKAAHHFHTVLTDPDFQTAPVFNRLTEDGWGEPTVFEVEFYHAERYYSYSLSVRVYQIVAEHLYEIFPDTGKDRMLFERSVVDDGVTKIVVAKEFVKTEKDKLLIELYEEQLLGAKDPFIRMISEAEHFGDLGVVYTYLSAAHLFVFPDSDSGSIAAALLKPGPHTSIIEELFKDLDTGAVRLELKTESFDTYYGTEYQSTKATLLNALAGKPYIEAPWEKKDVILTVDESGTLQTHRPIVMHASADGNDMPFELWQESDGTQRILELLPMVVYLMYVPGITVFVDEIGRSLHPKLLKSLLAALLEKQLVGQLVFTTHDTNLLDLNIFRQDEIWFVDKDRTGASRMHPLSDYKPRYDLDVRKNYLNGRFGGVPNLDAFENNQLEFSYGA
jgi:hypothetical protein